MRLKDRSSKAALSASKIVVTEKRVFLVNVAAMAEVVEEALAETGTEVANAVAQVPVQALRAEAEGANTTVALATREMTEAQKAHREMAALQEKADSEEMVTRRRVIFQERRIPSVKVGN